MMKNLSEKRELDESALLLSNENQELSVIQLRDLVYGVCHVTKEMDSIIQHKRLDSDSLESLSSLAQSCMSLDERLQAWEDQAFRIYRYHSFDTAQLWPPGTSLAIGGPSSIHVYSSISIASMWNTYRTTRIYLIRRLIRSLSRRSHDQGQTESIVNAGFDAQMES